MKTINYMHRNYLPKLRDDGKMTARVGIAYGAGSRRGMLMFTVYLWVTATRGKQELLYQVPALREYKQGGIPSNMQRDLAQFMLDVVAVQQECELHLHAPIGTR